TRWSARRRSAGRRRQEVSSAVQKKEAAFAKAASFFDNRASRCSSSPELKTKTDIRVERHSSGRHSLLAIAKRPPRRLPTSGFLVRQPRQATTVENEKQQR